MSPQWQYSHYKWHPVCPSLQTQRPELLSLRLLGCWLAPHLYSPQHTPSMAINTWSGLGGWVACPPQTSWVSIYICLQTYGITLLHRLKCIKTFFFFFSSEGLNCYIYMMTVKNSQNVYLCWICTWSCWLRLQSSPRKCRYSCPAPQLSGLLLQVECLLWSALFPTSCSL